LLSLPLLLLALPWLVVLLMPPAQQALLALLLVPPVQQALLPLLAWLLAPPCPLVQQLPVLLLPPLLLVSLALVHLA
jgi:hypothetical protein